MYLLPSVWILKADFSPPEMLVDDARHLRISYRFKSLPSCASHELLSRHPHPALGASLVRTRNAGLMRNRRSALRADTFAPRACACSGATHSSRTKSTLPSPSACTWSTPPGWASSVTPWHAYHLLSWVIWVVTIGFLFPRFKRKSCYHLQFKSFHVWLTPALFDRRAEENYSQLPPQVPRPTHAPAIRIRPIASIRN